MSFQDFCLYTVGELEWIFHYHRESREQMERQEWERMRLHAVMTMQPHCRNRLRAEWLLPFPWDHRADEPDPVLDREEALRRFEERVRLSETSDSSSSPK